MAGYMGHGLRAVTRIGTPSKKFAQFMRGDPVGKTGGRIGSGAPAPAGSGARGGAPGGAGSVLTRERVERIIQDATGGAKGPGAIDKAVQALVKAGMNTKAAAAAVASFYGASVGAGKIAEAFTQVDREQQDRLSAINSAKAAGRTADLPPGVGIPGTTSGPLFGGGRKRR